MEIVDATRYAAVALQTRGVAVAPADQASAAALVTGKMAPPPDVGLDLSISPVVYINEARWVVDCPWCPSAQLASEVDRRFWCPDCGNAAVGGLWVATTWPDEPEAIAAALGERPELATNWLPTESVEDLLAENDRMMPNLEV